MSYRDLRRLERTGCCARCGVVQFRADGKPGFRVCGWCACKEFMISGQCSTAILAAARDYASRLTVEEMAADLAINRKDAVSLRAHLLA